MRRLICMVACLLISFVALAVDTQRGRTFESRGQQRTYYEFVPDSIDTGKAVPLLIVLHGSEGRGAHMVNLWRDVARQNGFVVVGPDSSDPHQWRLREDSPEMFRDLVLALAREHAIDTQRIYLFGQSGGAVYALTLSLLESEFFAATAIHAGGWRESKEYQVLALHNARFRSPFSSAARTPSFQ